MAVPAQAPGRWLFGPGWDLLLGCGGAYALVFALQCLSGDALRSVIPFGLLPLVVLVTGVPHYGATLLRVYERRADRRAYRFFALWASLLVAVWFVFGVYDVLVGSLLVTLYLTWSPWHYTGQNYGIAVLFLRRRGVELDLVTKRVLYASFLLSYLVAFVGSHAATGGTYAPVTLGGSAYHFMRLGIPDALHVYGVPALAGLAFAAAAVAVLRLRRSGSWRDLAPALALCLTQSVWFTLPVLARTTGIGVGLEPFGIGQADYAFLWIAIGHSVQYLWVTTYYSEHRDRTTRRGPYLAMTLLAGGAIWGVPLFVFAPDVLGEHAFEAGLALLVAAAVNVHHFILDGAIWKLRDGRIARILVRDAGDEATDAATPGPGWIGGAVRGAVVAAGVGYVVATFVGTLEYEYGVVRASDPPDFARMRVAAERLRWVGRDTPVVHYNLGMQASRERDFDTARRELGRSLSLQDDPMAWLALGAVEQRSGRWRESIEAYTAVLERDPQSVAAWERMSQVWQRLGDRTRARATLERALLLAPERKDLRERLEQLRSPTSPPR